MKISIRKAALCGATCLTAWTVLGTTSAYAQEETAATAEVQEDAIIVTGSRIARPELAAPSPIVTVTAQQLERSGDVNVTDYLVRNPALVGSVGNAQAAGIQAPDVGYTGVNLLDLRNLGVDRTLVLVNGKRHVAGVPETAAVDINTIPHDLIERVDIMTGGASAIYGADGVSGVVNFVLKRDFEGLTARAQTGLTSYGDGAQSLISVTAGKNFNEGRGNVAVSYEYAKQNSVNSRARSFLGDSNKFYRIIRNPADFPDDPNIFDHIPVNDARWLDSSVDGAIDLDFDGIPDYTGSGAAYDRGTILPETGLTRGGSSTPLAGYAGDIFPETERHAVNFLTSYEFSPAVRFFAEGKYVSVDAFSVGQPSFDIYSLLPADNYFLNQRFGSLVTGDALMSRDNFDLGQRGEINNRETIRSVIGLDGQLSDNLRYEVSYVYGQTKAKVKSTNNRIVDRYFAALDAVDDGTGNPVCRSNVDGSGIIGGNFGGPAFSFTPGANSGCVPLNMLGNGVASQAALDWILVDAQSGSKVTQHVVSGHISGDTRGLFELQGGPISFALGAEYREEKSSSWVDDYHANGLLMDADQIVPSGGRFDVKEIFGELSVPVLADKPFAELLSFGAALRLSDYSSVGSTTAWKVDGIYAPVTDIRFRGSYSESVRAPNIGELYSSQRGRYAFIDDPCDPTNIAEGTQYRADNCLAALTGLGLTPDQIAAFSPASSTINIPGLAGSNPDLTEEKARTWTAGVVIRPSFIPRLTLTFDWYDIRINNAINTPTAQDWANNCVDQPALDNAFCPNIQRDGSTGYIIGWQSNPQNVAKFETAGLDATIAYNFPIGNLGHIDTNLVIGYLDKLSYVPSVGADVDDDLREPYKPRWTAAWDVNWKIGAFTAGYSLTWWDKTRRFTTEQIAANPDISDPKYFFYKERIEHDVRFALDVDDTFTFFGGVNNLTNSKPDFSLDYPVSAYGRYMYAGAKVKLPNLF